MGDISKYQRRLIQELKLKHRHHESPKYIIDRLDEYLRTHPDEEVSPVLAEQFEDLIRNNEFDFRAITREKIHRVHQELQNRATTEEEIPSLEISDDDKVVFLLGAGASYASEIPTVNGLLDELLIQARRTQREDLKPIIEYCDTHEGVDIEDLLTAAYLADFAVSNRHAVRLLHNFLFSQSKEISDDNPSADATSVNFIQDTLQTLFGFLTSTMIPKDPNPTHSAIREFVEEHPSCSIITTNYDYCMDEELLDKEVGVKDSVGTSKEEDYQESVSLIKMHGSINWSYCDSCQSVSSAKPSVVKETFEDETLDYPVIGICPFCHGQRRPLLVPPISFKFLMFPPLIDIWYNGRQKLREADFIISVGYSFSDSDDYIFKLVSNSMTNASETKLININPERNVTGRLQERFANELEDFDPESQIIGVHMNSEEAVPQLVNQTLPINTENDQSEETESEEHANHEN